MAIISILGDIFSHQECSGNVQQNKIRFDLVQSEKGKTRKLGKYKCVDRLISKLVWGRLVVEVGVVGKVQTDCRLSQLAVAQKEDQDLQQQILTLSFQIYAFLSASEFNSPYLLDTNLLLVFWVQSQLINLILKYVIHGFHQYSIIQPWNIQSIWKPYFFKSSPEICFY